MNFHHIPVLYKEVIEGLDIKEDGVYVDGTIGGGGHSKGICKMLKTGKIIGIDQDIEALEAAKVNLEEYNSKVIFVHDNFTNIKDILDRLNINSINGALIDLGVSSYQFDNAIRGFSYRNEAPLDMRMNRDNELNAYYVVNNYSEEKLAKIIFSYGEERWAKKIASNIVRARMNKDIKTTFELVDIIKKSVPAAVRRKGGHPAKKTFQAIRIEVNKELDILEGAIRDFIDVLDKDGVLAVISFHSLEDRIIKKVFNEMAKGCTCPPGFPVCICDNKPLIKILNKKPIISSKKELENNPRAKSAKLRIAKKIN